MKIFGFITLVLSCTNPVFAQQTCGPKIIDDQLVPVLKALENKTVHLTPKFYADTNNSIYWYGPFDPANSYEAMKICNSLSIKGRRWAVPTYAEATKANQKGSQLMDDIKKISPPVFWTSSAGTVDSDCGFYYGVKPINDFDVKNDPYAARCTHYEKTFETTRKRPLPFFCITPQHL